MLEERTRTLALADVSELRMVRPSYKRVGGGAPRGTFGSLVGATDLVFNLDILTPHERRDVVRRILQAFPPEGAKPGAVASPASEASQAR
ncbi:MAG: hypothetical protein H0V09_08215 [Gemmatimonadetes bacterium]|nr:hypothetical protein [Gemmatimonadota bacterium]